MNIFLSGWIRTSTVLDTSSWLALYMEAKVACSPSAGSTCHILYFIRFCNEIADALLVDFVDLEEPMVPRAMPLARVRP